MGTLKRKAIYCPKTEEHAHPKLLLLFSGTRMTIHCHEHQWMDIQLKVGGEIIDFDDISVEITDIEKGTYFDIEEIPAFASGEFLTKKDRKPAHA